MTLGSLKKIKLKLATVLAAILVIAGLAEIFALYQYGYRSLAGNAPAADETPRQVLDMKAYMNFREWTEKNSAYQIPDYTLAGEAVGRDNPLAEYR